MEFLDTRLSELENADTALDTRVTSLEENSSGGGGDSLYPYPYDSNGQCMIAVQFPDACFIPAITTRGGPDDGDFSNRYINLDYLMPVPAGTKFGQLYFTTPFVIPGANGLMPEREYTVQAIAFEAGSYKYDQIGYTSNYNIIDSGPTIFRTFDMSTDLDYYVVYGGGWQGEVVWTLSRKSDSSAADSREGPARLDLGIRRRLLTKGLLSDAIEGSLPTVYLQVTMSSH